MNAKGNNYEITKYACFMTCLSTAVTANLPPLLFLTLRDQFNISYSMLGFLVVLNFGTQMLFDLLFSFFAHRFHLKWIIRLTPAIMTVGLWLFAALPFLIPSAPYMGLVIGTVVFSAGGGLAEVLISPTVAAIPSPAPDKLMSRLHSCYAWGMVAVIAISTVFFALFGTQDWPYLTLILSSLPLLAALLLFLSPIPPLNTARNTDGAVRIMKSKTVILFFFCIFLGGAAECTMSQWCSGYIETAFGVSKAVGDLGGYGLFGIMLGIGRSLYSRRGKDIYPPLIFGAIGATLCYAVTTVTSHPIIGLIACASTGFFVSMLWPGTLIAVAERIPNGGVGLYALMATGGDLGAALCPQAVGVITDRIVALPAAAGIVSSFGISVEQLGMKSGMAFATLFPLIAAILFYFAKQGKKKEVSL